VCVCVFRWGSRQPQYKHVLKMLTGFYGFAFGQFGYEPVLTATKTCSGVQFGCTELAPRTAKTRPGDQEASRRRPRAYMGQRGLVGNDRFSFTLGRFGGYPSMDLGPRFH